MKMFASAWCNNSGYDYTPISGIGCLKLVSKPIKLDQCISYKSSIEYVET